MSGPLNKVKNMTCILKTGASLHVLTIVFESKVFLANTLCHCVNVNNKSLFIYLFHKEKKHDLTISKCSDCLVLCSF